MRKRMPNDPVAEAAGKRKLDRDLKKRGISLKAPEVEKPTKQKPKPRKKQNTVKKKRRGK